MRATGPTLHVSSTQREALQPHLVEFVVRNSEMRDGPSASRGVVVCAHAIRSASENLHSSTHGCQLSLGTSHFEDGCTQTENRYDVVLVAADQSHLSAGRSPPDMAQLTH